MKTVGFNFKKISAERISEGVNDLKINSGINIENISEASSSILKIKEEILQIDFNYTINYDPDFAKLEFSGVLLVALEGKKAKEYIKEWKRKQLPEDLKLYVFNIILRKANIKAIALEDELHLPIHINMPKVTGQKTE